MLKIAKNFLEQFIFDFNKMEFYPTGQHNYKQFHSVEEGMWCVLHNITWYWHLLQACWKKIWVCNWYRALQKALGPYYFPRVQLDLSNATWGQLVDNAFGQKLNPPFNPYANTLNFLLGMYTLPYVGMTGYVGTSPLLKGAGAKAVLTYLLFPLSFPQSFPANLLVWAENVTSIAWI